MAAVYRIDVREHLGTVSLPTTRQPPARIQIQAVQPQVDCGRYPFKRTEGDRVEVSANVFKDGHDILRGGRPLPARGRPPLAGAAARAGRQRSLGGQLRGGGARTLAVHDRGVGRPVRDDARRARPQARGRTDRPRGRAGRGGAPVRARRPRHVARRRTRARREGPAREDLARAAARGRRRARARPLRQLVRALSALLGRLRGGRAGAAAARGARFRRRLPAPDPPDRDDESQGPEQRPRRGEGRSREPVGDRGPGGRP